MAKRVKTDADHWIRLKPDERAAIVRKVSIDARIFGGDFVSMCHAEMRLRKALKSRLPAAPVQEEEPGILKFRKQA